MSIHSHNHFHATPRRFRCDSGDLSERVRDVFPLEVFLEIFHDRNHHSASVSPPVIRREVFIGNELIPSHIPTDEWFYLDRQITLSRGLWDAL